jgi:pseudouridylate synthase
MPDSASLAVHPGVRRALDAGRPVVALESTVLAHGLPWPDNLALGRRLEEVVRAGGATPATIAVLRGRLRVGLEPDELERVARGHDLPKLSRRDLPAAIARGGDGATTVAGTMAVAHLAGLRVMATGGIGGVHRGGAGDVSADLPELVRTPVLVVCAGAKAILDLPATLEWLETWGVPVVG